MQIRSMATAELILGSIAAARIGHKLGEVIAGHDSWFIGGYIGLGTFLAVMPRLLEYGRSFRCTGNTNLVGGTMAVITGISSYHLLDKCPFTVGYFTGLGWIIGYKMANNNGSYMD